MTEEALKKEPVFNEADTMAALITRPIYKNERCKMLKPSEIERATSTLAEVCKALADLATGRTGGKNNLIPLALQRESKPLNADEAKELTDAIESLTVTCGWKVKVPQVTAVVQDKQSKVPALQLEFHKDPLLLFIKSAINWMAQNGQRPLPSCREHSSSYSSLTDCDDSIDSVSSWVACSPPPFSIEIPIVTPPGTREHAKCQSDLGSDLDDSVSVA
eukprot:CAMPEP_0178746542 /NCGR_PEP_ID=MMETSP0744-20121128/7862_1 /TAXON_ID=913974 /ORGANISM="Nitzschia punctata, Strain CCMP561" /LENGTH=217 /DNA_ID=CAMNT_0020399755 /DNA_START=171 /DNA_END=824 /DNA_ORIENTATION=-